MKSVETVAEIDEQGRLSAQLPPGLAPGKHRVVIVVDEQITEKPPEWKLPKEPLLPGVELGPLGLYTFPGELPPELGTLRREELYGDDGR